MPYYKNKNILFIHIPKTGGTSLEEYLRKNDTELLFGTNYADTYLPYSHSTAMLHHQPYSVIYKNHDRFNIVFDDKLKIITIVRNPYTRIVSDLFFLGLINIKTTPADVYNILSNVYLISNTFKYQCMPQHKYILNERGRLLSNITIFKTETLTEDLHKYGFTDFNIQKNTNKFKIDKSSYISYLNNDSIKLINEFYKHDFIIFKYPVINVD